MSDTRWGGPNPTEFRGVNINVHPGKVGWFLEITPNPRNAGEAFRPPWRSVFALTEVPVGKVFTLAEHLSLLSMVLEDIAAERRDPVEISV